MFTNKGSKVSLSVNITFKNDKSEMFSLIVEPVGNSRSSDRLPVGVKKPRCTDVLS